MNAELDSKATRADIHRPAMMVPNDYRILAYGTVETTEDPETGREVKYLVFECADARWYEIGEPQDSTWAGHKDGRCDHCGARIKFWSVVEHKDGDIVTVGLTCTGRFFEDFTVEYFAKAKLESKALEMRLLRGWDKSDPALSDAIRWAREDTSARSKVRETASEYVRGWAMKEWQRNLMVNTRADFLRKLSGDVHEVPVGRYEISGVVCSVKSQPNPYARRGEAQCVTKVTIQDDRGFKVWGTLPVVAKGAKRGDRITLTATVERSANDPEFGTFSRPLKCTTVSVEESAS